MPPSVSMRGHFGVNANNLGFFVGLRRLRGGSSPLLNLPRQDYAALHPQF